MMASGVEPRWNPGTRKVVGATGFEPATPCAEGRGLAIPCDVMQNDDWSKRLISNDLTHVIAGLLAHQVARSNPAEIPVSRR